MYWEAKGAFTGESSCDMLKSAGCTYCIIGHSERRDYFHETDEDQNKKAKALVAAGLVPVFCCGESLEVREAGTYVEHVVNQVKAGLAGLEITCPKQVVVAYEPIWAIGTGKTATAEQAGEVCEAIRTVIRKLYGARVARSVTIQYGGSMNAKNAHELLAQPDVDGGLIGGASLKAPDFVEIVNAANQEERRPRRAAVREPNESSAQHPQGVRRIVRRQSRRRRYSGSRWERRSKEAE